MIPKLALSQYTVESFTPAILNYPNFNSGELHLKHKETGEIIVLFSKENDVLGQGGCGSVRKYSTEDGKYVVAVKTPVASPEPEENSRNFLRAQNEAKFLNIIYDNENMSLFHALRKETFCLLMPLFPGKSLAEYLGDPVFIKQNAKQIREAIALEAEKIHGLRIVHGDLSPGNVMIDAAGPVIKAYFIDPAFAAMKGMETEVITDNTAHWHHDKRTKITPKIPAAIAHDAYSLNFIEKEIANVEKFYDNFVEKFYDTFKYLLFVKWQVGTTPLPAGGVSEEAHFAGFFNAAMSAFAHDQAFLKEVPDAEEARKCIEAAPDKLTFKEIMCGHLFSLYQQERSKSQVSTALEGEQPVNSIQQRAA